MGDFGVKTIKELAIEGLIEGKKVLIRTDFNVPLKNGMISDDSRIKSTMPSIRFCLENGASQIILMSHLGRPKGKVDKKLSLKPVAEKLSELMNEKVYFFDKYLEKPIPKTKKLVLLENLRFNEEETSNEKKFSKKLASLGDIFIQDAFGTCHREHASTVGVPEIMKKEKKILGIGFLVEKELEMLNFNNVSYPFYAILGCAKISDKIEVIEELLKRVDKLFLGGAIVFTFLKAQGYEVGTSLVEDDKLDLAKKLLKEHKNKLVFPVDIVISDDVDGGEIFTVDFDKIPENMKGLDIGDESVDLFKEELEEASTIFWNGPLGVFEMPPFDTATRDIAEYLAKSMKHVVIGGGDTHKAINDFRLQHYFTHISTGGGAALELVAGHKLPAIEILKE